MSEAREGRMRLTLLGGFLGSGKTTWLRHQFHLGLLEDAHVIVNEAAATPVDDALLKGMASLEVLSGGCACCEARDELVARLVRLSDLRSSAASSEARPERVAVETSGLADPAAILEAIRAHPVLVHHIVGSETIVCIDALHGLNPGARIEGAIKGSPVALERNVDAEPEALPNLDGAASDPIFPTRLKLGEGVDWTAFGVWLSALLYARGDDVMRGKGVVRTPAGRLLLQSVRKVVQSPEVLPPQEDREDDTIVVIGRGYKAAADLSLKSAATCMGTKGLGHRSLEIAQRIRRATAVMPHRAQPIRGLGVTGVVSNRDSPARIASS